MEATRKTWNQRFKEVRHRFNRKVRDCLSLDKDGQEILKDFEASLINSFITSSSFEDIVHSNLNQRGRRKHSMAIVFPIMESLVNDTMLSGKDNCETLSNI